jgi:uncharacterized protein (TIGR00251 family)
MTTLDQIEVFSKGGRSCFRVRIQPRAAKNDVGGLYGKALKIRLTAPPLENRANLQLLEFLTKLLNLNKDQVSIVSGLRSRTKTVGILHLSRSELMDRLAQYLV